MEISRIENQFNENGELHGECVKYWENGGLAEIMTYKNGKRTGVYMSYYSSGLLNIIANFVDDEFHGKVVTYSIYANIERCANYSHGKRNGEVINYYPNTKGVIWEKMNYVDDVPHGEYIKYCSNGVDIKVKGQYLRGERVGIWYYTDYYDNHNVTDEINYGEVDERLFYDQGVNKESNGLWGTYHDNTYDNVYNNIDNASYYDQDIKENAYDNDGKEHGKWCYYSHGLLKMVINYYHGVKDGLVEYYCDNGEVIRSEYYEDDVKIF